MKKAGWTYNALRQGIRTYFIAFLALSFIMTIPWSHCEARSRSKSRPEVNQKYASIVMDAETGQILSQSNPDKSLHPASLTKIMTLLMVFEALDQGRLNLRDRITISRHAASMPPSKLGLEPGSSIRVQDAIYAVVTKSANDIAVALAERLGGSERGFAQMMTARARNLGMKNTIFINASGLHDSRQFSSARDMAKLARFVINTYPDYYRFYSTKSFKYAGHTHTNHNRLMNSYKGMDGMKTGYISQSGFNLVASAVRNNRRLIGVVFGGRSTQSRNTHMASLLNAGFATPMSAPVLMASARDIVPVPPRKPDMILASAESLNGLAPAARDIMPKSSLPNLLKAGIDPAAAGEIKLASFELPTQQTASTTVSAWAIQVGAFSSRAATDKALSDSMKKLPEKYAEASPMIAPLKTQEGWLFRARLHGFSRNEAFGACRYIKDCVPVAPRNN